MRFTREQLLKAATVTKASTVAAMLGLEQLADENGQILCSREQALTATGLNSARWSRAIQTLEQLGVLRRNERSIGDGLNYTIAGEAVSS